MIKILELGCGRGNHELNEAKIVGAKGFILGTDLSNKSLNFLKKRIFYKKYYIETYRFR